MFLGLPGTMPSFDLLHAKLHTKWAAKKHFKRYFPFDQIKPEMASFLMFQTKKSPQN